MGSNCGRHGVATLAGRGAVTGGIAALGILGVIAFLTGAILVVFSGVSLATQHTLDNGVAATAEVVNVDKVTHHRSHPYEYRTDPNNVLPGGALSGAGLIVPTLGVVLSSLLTAVGLGLLLGAALGYRRNRRRGLDT